MGEPIGVDLDRRRLRAAPLPEYRLKMRSNHTHHAARRRRRISLWIEFCLWAGGLIGLGFAGTFWGRALVEQAMGNRELDAALRGEQPPVAAARALPEGSLAGRIEIPRLELSAI